MFTKYVLESVKTESELINLYKEKRVEFTLFITKAVQMEFYSAFCSIFTIQENNVSYTEMKQIIHELEKQEQLFTENDQFESVLSTLISITFPKQFENYQVLRKVAKFITAQKEFKNSKLQLQYLQKLQPLVTDMLLLINIDARIAKLTNNTLSNEYITFIKKCLIFKGVDSQFRTFATKSFKEIMPGMTIKKIETIQSEIKTENKEFEIKDRKMWENCFNKQEIDLNNENMTFIVKYDITHEIKDNKIVFSQFDNLPFSTKIFNITKKYESKKVNKIGTAIKSTVETTTIDNPEITVKPVITKDKPNKFKHLYESRKRFLHTNQYSKEDTKYEERNENYLKYMKEQENECERQKEVINNNLSDIETAINNLEDRIEEEREEEMKLQSERDILERERRSKEETSKHWSSATHSFKPTAFKEKEINREDYETDESFEKAKKVYKMMDSFNNTPQEAKKTKARTPYNAFKDKPPVDRVNTFNSENNDQAGDSELFKKLQESYDMMSKGSESKNSPFSKDKGIASEENSDIFNNKTVRKDNSEVFSIGRNDSSSNANAFTNSRKESSGFKDRKQESTRKERPKKPNPFAKPK